MKDTRRAMRETLVPVQAYIPRAMYEKFKRLYRHHGAVSELIRSAFDVATAENKETDEAVRRAAGIDISAEAD